MDGILNINKSIGMTSQDVATAIRRLLKQKRVGHAGTLDPLASGVLPLCVGQATRVAEYLSESGKAYEAVIVFGAVTDTYDTEGQVVRTGDASSLTLEQIAGALPRFLGPQMQRPPLYSAIKIQGQPAYKRVRAGQDITLEPRPITITRLTIIAWESPRLTLAVECGKGTYIRSLAFDLGELLGCGAYLGGLVRTRSGPFTLADSMTLEECADALNSGTLDAHIFPPDIALRAYPAIMLDNPTAARVLHGMPFEAAPDDSTDSTPTLARVYAPDNRFIAIAEWDEERALWQPKKVFG
ncbi:MAG TPA: tRNA pseudouridine(55) synthase TruB [Ktedonobacteraceae bacterium]|nr:tRNA pseudouridine(55) synthase TruB [Ktedonobacteraceae bacterium]